MHSDLTLAVVTPSFNQGRYLGAAIESVLDQKYPGLRYAVVDGGSTDDSPRVIERYARHLDYWCVEPDGGQSAALVKGFARIGGDIRGWLNSDDEYVDGSFGKVISSFSQHCDAVVVYGERILIDRSGRVLGWSAAPPFDPETGPYTVGSETAFWRRKAEEVVGPIDSTLRFAMDLDFFGRLFLAGRFVKLPDHLGKFRCHDESKSALIPEVGIAEAADRWHDMFGAENDLWALPARAERARMVRAGLRHPKLLAIPYLRQRLGSRLGLLGDRPTV